MKISQDIRSVINYVVIVLLKYIIKLEYINKKIIICLFLILRELIVMKCLNIFFQFCDINVGLVFDIVVVYVLYLVF